MVSGTLPEELAVVLSSRFGVLEEDSGALWTERRSRRLLHALLGRPDSCPDHRPNFERLTLLGVDRDGMVHLIKSLFSVPVGLYSSDWQLFACCKEFPRKELPPVADLDIDALRVWRKIRAVPRLDYVYHLE